VELVGEARRGGQRDSVVHGKPADARSASSTNPQPRRPPNFLDPGGDDRERDGSIRTSIQGPRGSQAAATGERLAGRGGAGNRCLSEHAGALALASAGQARRRARVDGRSAHGGRHRHRGVGRVCSQRLVSGTWRVSAAAAAMAP